MGKPRFHCFFEQSGTFKKEFKKLGYEAFDYDILNDFGETDYQVDLFKNIEVAYERERESKPTLVGGVGEMKSNNGTQYYQQDRVYDSNEIALCQSAHEEFNPYYKVYPCLTPNREKKRQNGPRFRKEDSEMFTLTGQDIHGVGIAYDEQNGYFRKDGTVGTLTSDGSSPKHNNRIVEGIDMEENKPSFRIRRLTPRECWRLMGFTDEDFDKAKQVNSDSQLYKQAGNSIVVDVLEAIFGEML